MPKGNNKKATLKKEAEVEEFAKKLEDGSDSEEDAVVIDQPPTQPVPTPQVKPNTNAKQQGEPISDAEKELLREELIKTEDEISTLKQVLAARQKHSAELKRKLGLSPLAELSQDFNKSIKVVTDTEAYQKTAEVAAATSDTVKEKWNDMRNSSLFKSFESKLGTAFNQAKMAASTSIDHLSGAARGSNSTVATPVAEEARPIS